MTPDDVRTMIMGLPSEMVGEILANVASKVGTFGGCRKLTPHQREIIQKSMIHEYRVAILKQYRKIVPSDLIVEVVSKVDFLNLSV